MVYAEVPASIGQRLLAMIGHYRPGHGALSCPVLCRLRGPVDPAALRRAVDGLVAAHESLRTTFSGRGPRLTQVIHDPRPAPWVEATIGPDALATAIAAELADPVDITRWPLRATLWRIDDANLVLCLNIHHIVTDAWSSGLLFAQLRSGYARAVGQTPAAVPATGPQWQYRDFVAWQTGLLDGTGLDRHRAYWARQLAGLTLPRLPAPADETARTPGVTGRDLSPYLVAGLRTLARNHRTTLFTVTLALYYTVLARWCGQDDLAVASLFANRSRREAQSTVGFLANMVVLRTKLAPTATFADLIAATHATVIGAFAHQEQPFQTLALDPTSLGGGRADDVVFQMMAELDYRGRAGGVEFELLVPDAIGSRFGLELVLAPRGRGLRALLFHTASLDPATADRMLADYLAAAETVASNGAAPLAQPSTVD